GLELLETRALPNDCFLSLTMAAPVSLRADAVPGHAPEPTCLCSRWSATGAEDLTDFGMALAWPPESKPVQASHTRSAAEREDGPMGGGYSPDKPAGQDLETPAGSQGKDRDSFLTARQPGMPPLDTTLTPVTDTVPARAMSPSRLDVPGTPAEPLAMLQAA